MGKRFPANCFTDWQDSFTPNVHLTLWALIAVWFWGCDFGTGSSSGHPLPAHRNDAAPKKANSSRRTPFSAVMQATSKVGSLSYCLGNGVQHFSPVLKKRLKNCKFFRKEEKFCNLLIVSIRISRPDEHLHLSPATSSFFETGNFCPWRFNRFQSVLCDRRRSPLFIRNLFWNFIQPLELSATNFKFNPMFQFKPNSARFKL